MPLSGMEPNKVFTLPNTSPEITSYLPDSLEITIEENDSQEFSITVDDYENDDLYYNWKLDGSHAGSDSSYTYCTDYNSQGLHTLEVTVSDNVPENVPDTLVWSVTVNDFILGAPQVTIFIDGSDVILNWNPVAGASSYKIYSSSNPNDSPGSWTLEAEGIIETNWSKAVTEEKKFYYITSSN